MINLPFLIFSLIYLINSNEFEIVSGEESILNNFCEVLPTITNRKIINFGNQTPIIYANHCFKSIFNDDKDDGGAFHLEETQMIILSFCSFYKNINSNNGGAIYLLYSSFIMDNCFFEGNQALISGGGIFVSNIISTAEIEINKITNSVFKGNAAQINGGGFQIDSLSPLFLKNVTFFENEASFGSSIYMNSLSYEESFSEVTIENCSFKIQFTTNDRIRSNVEFFFTSVVFNDCSFLNNKFFSIKPLQFRHVQSTHSLVYFYGKNYVDGKIDSINVMNSDFRNISFSGNKNAKMHVKESVSARRQYIGIQSTIRIIKSHFNTIWSSENGGGIYIAFCSLVSIKNAEFTRTTTSLNGGAIYINQTKFEIFDSKFSRCSSNLDGGAIYVDAQHEHIDYIIVFQCEFDQNRSYMNGGAILIKNSVNILLNKCLFSLNAADMNGKSIFSYGKNDFIFYIVSTNFFSQLTVDPKAEIELNSFQFLVIEKSFFTTNTSKLQLNETKGLIFLKGRHVITWTTDFCCFNTDSPDSIQTSVYDPRDNLHLKCNDINPYFESMKKQNFNRDSSSKKLIVPVVELPKSNLYLQDFGINIDDGINTIYDEYLPSDNFTNEDNFTLKINGKYCTVLPVLNQSILVYLLVNRFKDLAKSNDFFILPICNDSTIYLSDMNSTESNIGLYFNATSSNIIFDQQLPNISLKGSGNISIETLDINTTKSLSLYSITVFGLNQLNLSFSSNLESVKIDRLHFHTNGQLLTESNDAIISARQVTVHQSTKSNINSLSVEEKIEFKINSRLEVTEKVKFNSNSVMVVQFNSSTIKGKWISPKSIFNFEKDEFPYPILSVPYFSNEMSGIPSQIIVKANEVFPNFLMNQTGINFSMFHNFQHTKSKAINQKLLSPSMSLLEAKNRRCENCNKKVDYNSLNKVAVNEIDEGNVKELIQDDEQCNSTLNINCSSENYTFDNCTFENCSSENSTAENIPVFNVIYLICSNDFDFYFCLSLINSSFISFDNNTFKSDCIVDSNNQTCLALEYIEKISEEKLDIRLNAKGVVGFVFGSILVTFILLAVIFAFNKKDYTKYSGVRLYG